LNYFICGFSGAGKSTLLSELSALERLSACTFIDLDEWIYKKFGTGQAQLGDLIRDIGIDQFRKYEKEGINFFSSKSNIVLALGAGAVNQDTHELLNSERWSGLWLNVDFDVCYERIKNDNNRPLTTKGRHYMFELYNSRKSGYSQYFEVKSSEQVAEFMLNNS
jgi:shikimate kinase